jgi:hypothetical protein
MGQRENTARKARDLTRLHQGKICKKGGPERPAFFVCKELTGGSCPASVTCDLLEQKVIRCQITQANTRQSDAVAKIIANHGIPVHFAQVVLHQV